MISKNLLYQIDQSPGKEYVIIKGQKLRQCDQGLEDCCKLETIAIPVGVLDHFIEMRQKGLTGITNYNPPVPEGSQKKESA